VIDFNEWRTEKRHECANMGKVKRLALWWQLYRTSFPVWDLETFRPMDFCWQECTYTCGNLHNHKKPVRTRESGRNSNQTPQEYIQKRCCLNHPLLRQFFWIYTITLNQRQLLARLPSDSHDSQQHRRNVPTTCIDFLLRFSNQCVVLSVHQHWPSVHRCATTNTKDTSQCW